MTKELEITEYTIKAKPSVRICKSIGFPVGQNRNWYILRGPGDGVNTDYWTKRGWAATTPARFTTAVGAFNVFMKWLAKGNE